MPKRLTWYLLYMDLAENMLDETSSTVAYFPAKSAASIFCNKLSLQIGIILSCVGQKPSLKAPDSGVMEIILFFVVCSPYIQSSEAPFTK